LPEPFRTGDPGKNLVLDPASGAHVLHHPGVLAVFVLRMPRMLLRMPALSTTPWSFWGLGGLFTIASIATRRYGPSRRLWRLSGGCSAARGSLGGTSGFPSRSLDVVHGIGNRFTDDRFEFILKDTITRPPRLGRLAGERTASLFPHLPFQHGGADLTHGSSTLIQDAKLPGDVLQLLDHGFLAVHDPAHHRYQVHLGPDHHHGGVRPLALDVLLGLPSDDGGSQTGSHFRDGGHR